MAGPKQVFNCYSVIGLVLTFGVSHQDLVLEDNDEAKVYAISEIRNPSNLH